MTDNPTAAGVSTSPYPFACSVAIPEAGIRGLSAGIKKLDRLGATLCLDPEPLGGITAKVGDSIELDVLLPQNRSFRPRTLRAIGSVIRVNEGAGRVWLVIRFHSLQFCATAERPGEDAAMSRGTNARGAAPTGDAGAEVGIPRQNVK